MKHKYDIGRYKYQFNTYHRIHCIIDTNNVQYDLEYVKTDFVAPIDVVLNYGTNLCNNWESINEKKQKQS